MQSNNQSQQKENNHFSQSSPKRSLHEHLESNQQKQPNEAFSKAKKKIKSNDSTSPSKSLSTSFIKQQTQSSASQIKPALKKPTPSHPQPLQPPSPQPSPYPFLQNQSQSSSNPNLKCNICFSQYNFNRRRPIIVCQNNHTYCLYCVVNSLIHKKTHCPMCRAQLTCEYEDSQLIDKMQEVESARSCSSKNSGLHSELIVSQKLEKKISRKKKKIKLSFKNNSTFCKKFSEMTHIVRQGSSKFIKKQSESPNSWSMIVLYPELNKSFKENNQDVLYFDLEYKWQKENNLSFGIAVFDTFQHDIVQNIGFETKIFQYFGRKTFKKNKHQVKQQMSNKSEEKVQKKQQKTQPFLEPPPLSSPSIHIRVEIDLQRKDIKWINPKGQSYFACEFIQLEKVLGKTQFYPYFAIFNAGDQVIINNSSSS